MRVSKNQLRDCSSLFTRSEIFRFLKNDFTSIDLKLKRYSIYKKYISKSYLFVLKDLYKQLKNQYPNEYIVKNELINQICDNKNKLKNSKVFNEFRIGKAIGDITVFNGESEVYEIKSILDSKYRLNQQLNEYKKVFNKTYIVISEKLLNKYLDLDADVGIMTFNNEMDDMNVYKEATSTKTLDTSTLMETLHSKEYIEIVRKYYGELPQMSSFTQFQICKNLINGIKKDKLNGLFVETIKNRNVYNTFSISNNILNQMCLSLNLNKERKKVLIENLKTIVS